MNRGPLHMDVSEEFSLVTKVGAVVLRMGEDGVEVLAIQPRPKPDRPNDYPPIGLIRGTRCYRDPVTGKDVDAVHDGRTPPPEGAVLEPVWQTLTREIEEEAGITPAMLAAAQVTELGPRTFPSKSKPPYPIHWFLVQLNEEALAQLPHTGMKDSLCTQWLTREDLEILVDAKKVSPGYLDVLDWALARFRG